MEQVVSESVRALSEPPVSFHRSKAGAEWRSCKAKIGRLRFMATVHAEGWAGVSVQSPIGFVMVQRHPGRFIVHGRLTHV
jgi:hypothetical protein